MSLPSLARPIRLILVLLALVVYLAIDGMMLNTGSVSPQWAIRVNTHTDTITWVDPNGPAVTQGLQVGDRLLRPSTSAHMAYGQLASLYVPRLRRTLQLTAFGPTRSGQALVLVGVLLLLVGGLAWAYGRNGRASTMLGMVSAMAALSLLCQTWGLDGHDWAMRLAFVAGVVLFPLSWAALFLSFPRDRHAVPRWRRPFVALLALALFALLAYGLCFLVGLPYVFAHLLGSLTFLFGLLLGLAGLYSGTNSDSAQARQQRRIVALSAAGAMLPVLLLSFMPALLLGHALVPFEVAALALVVLPLGLAYAIVRYDLMELDVVVRRLVAVALASLALVGGTVLAALALRPLLPALDVFSLVIAVLAGAVAVPHVAPRTRALAELLLSPELMRSRRALAELDPAALRGEDDLATLAGRLETAARAVTGVPNAHLLVRRRVPGAIFCALHDGAAPLSLPLLATTLAHRPWGLSPDDGRGPAAPTEWAAVEAALGATPAVLVPLVMRGEAIALLAVMERSGEAPLRGPDREAVALLARHFALAVDHGRVRAELEAEGADAAAFSAASARLTAALDDRASLPSQIVEALAALRDVCGASLLLYQPDGSPALVAQRGDDVLAETPPDPTVAAFAHAPYPRAWLPLSVGGNAIGALCLRWSDEHIIREHDRRLLSAYANGAAMALEHARLYERARIQAERDPVTDLYNHRAFHTRLEAALERARTKGGPVGMLLIDLADFKLFNDTHGHQAGDQALRRVGEVLQACCRTSDAAARLGGDEFAVLLPDADIAAARAMAERITDLATLSALTSPDGQRLPVRLSIGVSAFPADAGAANALLSRADERMYEAKRSGVAISTVGRTDEHTDHGEDGARFGILEALVAMVDNRDRYTGEHSEQVATYACALGAELGLSRDTLETLRLAGLLHDVGKIGVPDRILRKPGKLTDEEFDIVKRHVELSEALLTVVSQDRDLMDAVRYHHERWDGRGYPRQVPGEEIPLLGRIMIVADAVSAMGMDRPYRKGLSWEVIAQELTKGSGAQFDPMLVAPALRALQPYLARDRAA